MTQEEKAKAYDRALEIAKAWYKLDNNDLSNDDLETLFPELKESEDERIRKELIVWLKNSEGQTLPIDRYNAALAWLEKQGEQKASYTTIVETGNGGINALVTRELSNSCDYEEKPVIKMKSPEESLGISSKEYNDIVNDCLYGEQKPTNSYCQEHCKGYQETGKCFADGDCRDKREAERKSAWSEEDEVKINRIVACLENLNVADNDILLKDVDWLKSLRPQLQWKPSDEQMKALADALSLAKNCGEEIAFDLRTLHEQLKKLREE